MTEIMEAPTSSETTPRRRLGAWLREGSFGPTDLSRRGCILVLVSVLAVLVPVAYLAITTADHHVALKVWVVTITVIAVLGAVLRVIADVQPNPQGDLDRAGKLVGAIAAVYTALAVIIDWGFLHL